MTVQYLDDPTPTAPEAAHAASEFGDYDPPRRRWGFSSSEQAAETLADWVCIAVIASAAVWAVWP